MDYGGAVLTSSLEANVALIKRIFENDGTVVERRVENRLRPKARCCIFFIDGMASNQIVDEYIVKPIIETAALGLSDDPAEELSRDVLSANDIRREACVAELVKGLIAGDTLVFAEGSGMGLIVSSKGFPTRAVSEPDGEKALRGPREGFTESILVNLTLVRRKLHTPDLKMKFRSFGTRSGTRACIVYLESLTDPALLAELERRLDLIDIDGVLDSNYIAELIKDDKHSPFKTIGTTERPRRPCRGGPRSIRP